MIDRCSHADVFYEKDGGSRVLNCGPHHLLQPQHCGCGVDDNGVAAVE